MTQQLDHGTVAHGMQPEGHRQLIGSCRKGATPPLSCGLQLARDIVPNAVSI